MTTPSALIDEKIAALTDWRGAALARLRALIRQAGPDITEAVKWRKPSNPLGVPVWEHDGIICTGETYRDKVKLTFAHGAALADRRPVQFEPRRRHPPRDRPARRRADRQGSTQNPHPRRRRAQRRPRPRLNARTREGRELCDFPRPPCPATPPPVANGGKP
ncbi:MAG: DUF1801 domain-containing protein [Sphingomicrobium sp.]